jgi:hypothetical protein
MCLIETYYTGKMDSCLWKNAKLRKNVLLEGTFPVKCVTFLKITRVFYTQNDKKGHELQ